MDNAFLSILVHKDNTLIIILKGVSIALMDVKDAIIVGVVWNVKMISQCLHLIKLVLKNAKKEGFIMITKQILVKVL